MLKFFKNKILKGENLMKKQTKKSAFLAMCIALICSLAIALVGCCGGATTESESVAESKAESITSVESVIQSESIVESDSDASEDIEESESVVASESEDASESAEESQSEAESESEEASESEDLTNPVTMEKVVEIAPLNGAKTYGEKTGCASAVGVTPVASILVAFVAMTIRKKKED